MALDRPDLSCDVLVIGGGLAGCMAALNAREKGASVILIEKSAVQRSGSAASGLDHARGVYPVDGTGTPDEFADSFMRQSDGMASWKLLRIIGEEMPERMFYLEKFGLKIRDEQGRLYLQAGVGTNQSFILSFQGEDLKKRFDQALQEKGATVINRTMPTRLMMDGTRLAGASVVNTRTGEFSTISARAVVLATGGAIRVYPSMTGMPYNTVGCPYNTGDAYALGHQVGAEMVNFEFPQVMLTLKNYAVPGYAGAISTGARVVNALGERVMEKYHPQMLERAPRHFVCLAVYQEMLEGRGPCYFDFRHVPEEKLSHYREGLRNERAMILRYFDQKGLDLHKDLVEIESAELSTHNGGVAGLLTDEGAATNIPGLYAAGDCAGGVGYCAGSNAMVFGWRAGGSASQYASGTTAGTWPADSARAEKQRALSPLGRTQGPTGRELEAKIQKTMADYVGMKRNDASLRTAIRTLENLRNFVEDLQAETPQDLLVALEAENTLLVGDMMARTALMRTETRWSHQRVDYPNQDDANWKKFLVATGKEGRTVLYTRALPA
ncbi:MAG: FAD-dependent oxidoreductase [Dehalococcoidia bacterium]|nr:FAD-dependent oxidoreductase [Dehalococcoidia bacterium]